MSSPKAYWKKNSPLKHQNTKKRNSRSPSARQLAGVSRCRDICARFDTRLSPLLDDRFPPTTSVTPNRQHQALARSTVDYLVIENWLLDIQALRLRGDTGEYSPPRDRGQGKKTGHRVPANWRVYRGAGTYAPVSIRGYRRYLTTGFPLPLPLPPIGNTRPLLVQRLTIW